MRASAPAAGIALCLALLCTACQSCGGATEPPPDESAAAPAAHNEVTFADVTSAAGIAFRHVSGAYGHKYLPETMGSGVAVLDYDGDGRPDIFFVNGTWWPDDPGRPFATGEPPRSALYRNKGDGTFEDRTIDAGLGGTMYGMGATAADYDNDGDTDLFVTALGPDRLYRNDGGVFTEIGAPAGVADPGFGSSATFFDYDHDGDVDLFVCNYVEWTIDTDIFCSLDGQEKSYCTPESYKGQSSRLFRNDGHDRFTDVSAAAGVLNPAGKSLGVTTIDFDEDGWEDIVVANDTQPNYLYRNNGDGTFTDVGVEAGIAYSESGIARGAMGIDSGDYDGSGRESLVIGNFSNEMIGLYHNEGSGIFIDDAPRAGVGLPSLLTLAFGTFFFDYDLDGSLDIFAANGHVEDDINRVQKDITHAQRPHLFRNNGDGTFAAAGAEASAASGPLQESIVARGAAYLDYDGDGDLDIVLTTNNGPGLLWRNDGGNANGWLRVRLVGTRSNRDGVGARVTVTAGGRSRSQMVKAGSSYCSRSEPIATFGLGKAERAEAIEVVWPGGDTQRIDGADARELITITQGAGADAVARAANR